MRKPSLCLILISLVFSGCSALMPTKDIESKDATGEYPLIGDLPPGETKTLSPEERDKMVKDLTVAREKNKKATAAPLPAQTP